MTREEAAEILRDTPIDLRSTREDDIHTLYATAQMMAIDALLQERPKGRWIDAYPEIEKNPMFQYGICSECGFEQAISNKLNYCPNCGAEMER